MVVVQDLDVLVYSSHKTASQTAVQSLRSLGLRVCHCHTLTDLFVTMPARTAGLTPAELRQAVRDDIHWRAAAGRKLIILTIVRNPLDRLVSSFFQSFHSDEVNFKKVAPGQTTVSRHDESALWRLFVDAVRRRALPGRAESVDELEELLSSPGLAERLCGALRQAGAARADFDLPADVVALDFGAAVSDMAGSLRRALGVVVRVVDTNLSARKSYFRKYQDLRRRARYCPEYAAMVRAQYRPCFSNVPTARARQAPAP